MSVGLYMAVGAGDLTLQSPDLMIQPRLHYNYLQKAFDQQRLCDGVGLRLQLAGHKIFSAIMDTLYQPMEADLASKVVMHLVCFGEEPGIVGLARIVHYM